ncbi:MAG: IS66 family transposase zinc-finger binding domain-containing protein [Saprospiraceae bacterium]|nr:IS66 family transposase zinc-finger binding domain-containing protein [Saprospiraceae bacterium]
MVLNPSDLQQNCRSSEFVWRSANGDPRPVDEVELVVRKKKRKGEQPVREKISESLRREVIVINPDVDTNNMDRIGEAISEKLEIKPAEIYVIRTVRPNYLDHEGTFHIAPLNDPFPKSNAGASFAADIAVKSMLITYHCTVSLKY